MAVLFKTDKAVLYEEKFQNYLSQKNWKSREPVWYVYSIDDQPSYNYSNDWGEALLLNKRDMEITTMSGCRRRKQT